VLCVIVLIFGLFYLAVLIVSVVEFITNKDKFKDSINDVYNTHEPIPFVAIIGLLILMNALPMIFLTNLMVFHLWLYYKGMSTFDYIMSKREKEQEIKQKLKELEEALKREEEKYNRHNSLSCSKSSTDRPQIEIKKMQEEY
jgi:hypothetical protein